MRTAAHRLEHLHTLSRLWRHPGRSRDEILAFRDRKLRSIVRHAAAAVPYYRELFAAAGLRAGDVRGAADLAAMPTTTKRALSSRPVRDVVAQSVDPDRLLQRYTAGSTGEPTRVRRTPLEEHLLNQFRLRAMAGLGVRLRDRIAHLSSPGVSTDRTAALPGRLREAAGIHRTTFVDCLRSPEEMVRDLDAIRPDVIVAYASTLVELIEPWSRSAASRHAPRLVFCGGDVMTSAMRARIELGFGAECRDLYGSHEFNLLGWECAATGDFHLCDDAVIVEVLREGRPVEPGEAGELVATGLHSYAAPYLRYELGDVAVAGDDRCRCGAPFATIRAVQGRVMEALVLPGGRVMHPWELLPMTFWDMPWHRLYQLVQEAPERLVLRVVSDGELPLADVEQLRRAILEKTGPGATFRVERIDEVERARSGKWRSCVSLVDRSSPPGRPPAT